MRRSTVPAAVLAATLALGAVVSPAPADADPARKLGYDPATGRLIFVGTEPGRPVPSRNAGQKGVPPEQNALSFVEDHAQAMGLREPDQELRLIKTSTRPDGRTVVRYQQVHEGVPVFGADVVVNTNRAGALLSLSAKISPELGLPVEPQLRSEEASAEAVAAIAKYHRTEAAALEAGVPSLWIYDARLFLPDGRPPVLVWRVEVGNGARIREVVLVDAATGAIALHYNRADTRWPKATAAGRPAGGTPRSLPEPASLGTPLMSLYTMSGNCQPGEQNATCLGFQALPGTALCTEANPAACSGDPDAADAFNFGLDTYDFFATSHGRDSIDGAGMRIVQSVHYGLGYENAFWNGSQMVYGDGFSAADDVVGHELTHGVTEFTSGLIYFGQPGAINESLSDIWGELIDQSNGVGTDTPAVKWLLGEDIPGVGAIRSMKNPPAFKNPDKMMSPFYYTGPQDNFGVHINSGVNNKAAFLLVDGGTFGGKTVAPLGIQKVADIYYEVQTNLLGSGANYIDLYHALFQACRNLVGTGGITADDCQAVRNATDAVQMNKTKSATIYPTVDYCNAGQTASPSALFGDDFELGASAWGTGVLVGSNRWFLDNVRSDSSSGANALVWSAVPTTTDSVVGMASDVLLPPGSKPFLRFEHDLWGFESQGSVNFDGGVVEYSTDGGNTWFDLGTKYNGGLNYGGVIVSGQGNPLGGRKAFVRATVNYTASKYALSSLAGRPFRFRLRAASDSTVASGPWFIDDVRIYTCLSTPKKPALLSPGSNALVTDYTPRLDWSDATPDLASYDLQVATDAAFTGPLYDQTGLLTSEFTVPTDLAPNGKYYWRVRSLNAGGTTLGWTPARVFRTAMTAPVLSSPANGAMAGTRRPVFDWNDVAGATGYTVQISKAPTFVPVLKTVNIKGAISTYTPPTDLPAATLLYWRVRATGPNGPSLYSGAFSLTTGN